jgi:hypothetical protein
MDEPTAVFFTIFIAAVHTKKNEKEDDDLLWKTNIILSRRVVTVGLRRERWEQSYHVRWGFGRCHCTSSAHLNNTE